MFLLKCIAPRKHYKNIAPQKQIEKFVKHKINEQIDCPSQKEYNKTMQ